MCGIIGSVPAIDQSLLQEGMNVIAHRGPDGRGIWRLPDSDVTFGHCRLSILDLSDAGKQPMEFEDLTLTYNGEIYNYLEIKSELIRAGYQFFSETDTEVVLKAYHLWGESCFQKFNGMWALAIYNRNRKSLLLSRDRYGEKPLYYYNSKSILLFASEVKAIHKVLGKSHPLNHNVITELVSGRNSWNGTTETYLKDVSVLPGGHLLHYRDNSLRVAPWYALTEVNVPKTLKAQAEELRQMVIDACRLRLRSDVPVGTCLSGGLDSGSITGVLRNVNTGQYTHRSFCASFPDTPIDEASKALRIARQLGSQLDIVEIFPPQLNELEKALRDCDGPMHALAFYPIWKLYQHIRGQGILVTLDGQGPDEMLGGYRPIVPALQYAFRSVNPMYLKDVYDTYSNQGETAQVSSRKITRTAMRGSIKSEVKRVAKKLLRRHEDEHFAHPFRSNPFDEEMYRQFFRDPLPGILQQYDRCSMAHGVECRMPFMDYRIVEFVFSLPVSSRVGGGYTKRVLREAMKGIVPDETRLDRQKIGFNAPIIDWYRGPLKEFLFDQMSSTTFLQDELFDGQKLRQDFEKFNAEQNPQWDRAWRFWGPVHYSWWKNNLKK
jgi:asparagine synthase (glutamine-hydrolysing)